jgi:hypothetical protein
VQIQKSGNFSVNSSGFSSGFLVNTIAGLPTFYDFSAISGAGQEPEATFMLSLSPNQTESFVVTTFLGDSAFASDPGSSSVSVLEQGFINLRNTSTNGSAFTLSLTGAYGFEISAIGSSPPLSSGGSTITRAFSLNDQTLVSNTEQTNDGTVTEPLEQGPTTPFGTFLPGHNS